MSYESILKKVSLNIKCNDAFYNEETILLTEEAVFNTLSGNEK